MLVAKFMHKHWEREENRTEIGMHGVHKYITLYLASLRRGSTAIDCGRIGMKRRNLEEYRVASGGDE